MSTSGFKKIRRSIRTHFGILTACILLSLLFVFYLGGRYIMINIIRQAEKEISSVSNSIKRIVSHQVNALQQFNVRRAGFCAGAEGEKLTAVLQESILPNQKGIQTQLAAVLNRDGTLREGYYSTEGTGLKPMEAEMVARYFNSSRNLDRFFGTRKHPVSGVIAFMGAPHYISITPVVDMNNETAFYLCLGSVVHGNLLFQKISEVSHGLSVDLNERRAETLKPQISDQSPIQPAPIFEEDQLFAAGSEWHVGSNEFEAVIPIYDILGEEITSLSIRFPRSFASLTTLALGYLTVFVAVVGMIFIAPVFWLQSRIILDPLTRLEKQIQAIGEKYKDGNVDYLNYTSDDEFGRVARSVDSLLQELNSKSKQISANAQRHKVLIAGMPDCLCIFHRDKTLVSVEKQPDNAPPIPGLLERRSISSESFKDDSIVRFEKALDDVFENGEIRNVSLICRDVSGVLRYFETRITRMDEERALVVFRDMTRDLANRKKREKLEARAGKAQQMSSLGNMAAGIAHDFNNVLTIIKNTLELEMGSGSSGGPKGEMAVAIKEAANRGCALVQELMTYAGQGTVNLRRMNPTGIITELTPLYKGVVQPSVNLELSQGDNLHDVMVDVDQFWKVIVNLVKNAAESIKSSHGYIKISTYNYELTRANAIKFFSGHTLEPDQGVVFEVADNGVGIPQEIVDRLFEPFFSTKAVSRGLGLATVFGIVESHNGGISIISHENIGTKFRVWLPAAEEEDIEFVYADEALPEAEGDETPTVGPGTITLRSGSGKPVVLIIDDDASIIKTTSLLLNKMGVDTLEANSRTEALARFRKYRKRINLVIMDAQLGNLDSVRLLATLRMNSDTLPVVVCSGHAREKVQKMFENSRIDGILIKPYTMVELKEMLSRFITLPTEQA